MATATTPKYDVFHVLIRPQSDGKTIWWVAQCLERDITAQAKTLEDLEHEFQRVFAGRIEIGSKLGIDPLETLPPAPAEYWDLWSRAKKLEPGLPRPFRSGDPAPWLSPPAWEARVA